VCNCVLSCRGFVGSGLCIFSRYPIAETLYQEFPLNGQAHKVLHGDWYASKGCGLAILKVKDMTVNVYTSHVSISKVESL